MFRKGWKALAVAIVGAVGLAACGGGGGSSASEQTDPAATTGTLRVLVPSYPASNDGKAALDKVVASFNQKYPNVKVEPDFATFDTLNQKISTSIAGGQGYDVLVTGAGWIPPFASKGVFADLSTLGVTKESLSKSTNPAMLPAAQYQGKYYAVPLIASPKPLALRKSLFEKAGLDPNKPPTTLEEIKADAEKLTVKNGSGDITQAGFDFWAAPGSYRQDFVTFLGAQGVPLYDENAQPKFNGPEGVKVLDWMSSMVNNVQKYGAQNSAKTPLVLSGEAAMGFAGSYVDCSDAGVSKKVCDDLVFFNAKDTAPAMFTGGQLASVGAKSKLKNAAYDFIQEMNKPEAVADIAKLNFAVPAAESLKGAAFVKSNPASTFAAANLGDAVFEGGPANWLDVRGQFGTALDDALLGKKSSQDVLNELAAIQ